MYVHKALTGILTQILFRLQVVESSSLVSVLFREALSHPYISFFHLLVNGYSVTSKLNNCLEMDSLLPIETKKQKLHQTDKAFNFHSVSLRSQAPLVSTEPLFIIYSSDCLWRGEEMFLIKTSQSLILFFT